MAAEFTVVSAQSYVNLTIYTSLNAFGVEKRFGKDILIADLKNKLEMITGLQSGFMTIKLLSREKKFLCDLDDDSKMLGFYPCEDGHLLEVNATNAVEVVDDPNFTRYEIAEADYAKKTDTVRQFKKNMKLGEFADGASAIAEAKAKCLQEKIENEKSLIDAMKTGDRCQVRIINAPTRLGTVMYLGALGDKPGYFVGVKYDEPLGKNDGSVDGKRYFTCSPNYGGFIKPDFITVGDFPEEDFNIDDEF